MNVTYGNLRSWCGAWLISAIACALPVAEPALAATRGLTDIRQAYQRQYDSIESLGFEYDAESTSLVAPDVLHRCTKRYELPPKHGVAIICNDGRTYELIELMERPPEKIYQWLQTAKKRPDAAFEDFSLGEIQEALIHVKPEPWRQLHIFDGERLLEPSLGSLADRGVERDVVLIRDPAPITSVYFTSIPLTYPLITFPTGKMPPEDEFRRMNRIPDLLESAPYEIVEAGVDVGGTECVRVEAPQVGVLWLAPKYNFAVKKRHMFMNGSLRYVIECDAFRKVTSEMWLASRMNVTEYAVADFMPDEYHGDALVRIEYRFSSIEANAPEHAEVFNIEPGAGAVVLDQTLVPSDEREGRVRPDGSRTMPTVRYVMPADESDLDDVIATAVAEQTGRNWWPLGLWTTIALINLVIFSSAYVVMRRRARSR